MEGSDAPKLALLLTGDVAMAGIGGAVLSGSDWRFTLNELDDLDAAPVTVQTGSGDVVLALADGATGLSGQGTLTVGTVATVTGTFSVVSTATALTVTIDAGTAQVGSATQGLTLTGVSGSVTSTSTTTTISTVTGTGTLTLGDLGHLSGTFTVASTATGVSVTGSAVTARLTAGSAYLSLTGGTGALDIEAGEVSGTLSGTVGLYGVPGLTLTGTLTLDLDTATDTFELAGPATASLDGLLGLDGTVAIAASGAGDDREIAVTFSGTSTNGTALSGTVVVTADGSFTVDATTELSLPTAIPGVTLTGTATVTVDSSAGTFSVSVADAVLTTPVGSLSADLTISRSAGVLTLALDGTGELFLGDRRAAGDDTDDIGLELTLTDLEVRLLPNGAVAVRAAGTAAVVNAPELVLGGDLVVEYNPTSGALTLDGATVAANTTRVVGTAITFGLGDVRLAGDLTVVRQGTGDDTSVTIDATGVTGSIGGVDGQSGARLTLSAGSLHLELSSAGYALHAGASVQLEDGPADIEVSGAVTIDLADGAAVTVTGVGLVVHLGPVRAAGDVTVTVTDDVVTLTVAGGSLDLGDAVSVDGVTGHVTLGDIPDVDLSATTATLVLRTAEHRRARLGHPERHEQRLRGRPRGRHHRRHADGRRAGADRDAHRRLVRRRPHDHGRGHHPGLRPDGLRLVEITDGSLTLTVSEDGVVGTVTATVDVALGNLSVDDAEGAA